MCYVCVMCVLLQKEKERVAEREREWEDDGQLKLLDKMESDEEISSPMPGREESIIHRVCRVVAASANNVRFLPSKNERSSLSQRHDSLACSFCNMNYFNFPSSNHQKLIACHVLFFTEVHKCRYQK